MTPTTTTAREPLLAWRELALPLDWQAAFGRDAPRHVEIGIGKGRSLLEAAKANPAGDYIGIELVRKYARLVARRASRRGLGNLRVVCDDASDFLREAVAPESLAGVAAYCPDPWPKARHHKRRLFSYGFVHIIATALAPGGEFVLVTDHLGYFDEVLAHVEANPLFAGAEATMRRPEDGADAARTNYERKWLALGRCVFTMRARRDQRP